MKTSCSYVFGFCNDDCGTDLSFCAFKTCLNGGTCQASRGAMIICIRQHNYSGNICDDNCIACTNEMCLNGGTCVEEFGPSYSCNCMHGYDGTNCSNDLSFCTHDVCENGANLVLEPPTLNTCSLETCKNGGVCMNRNNTNFEGIGANISCNCLEGYTGKACEVDINNPCQFLGCKNNGPVLWD